MNLIISETLDPPSALTHKFGGHPLPMGEGTKPPPLVRGGEVQSDIEKNIYPFS